uniref:Uncharacterized protein n=1 Tax=Timema genevievae TaxID=629358 RepID=A0A7R9PIR5_TIMGE|nr:unnamed protein product [Timema genevievae]
MTLSTAAILLALFAVCGCFCLKFNEMVAAGSKAILSQYARLPMRGRLWFDLSQEYWSGICDNNNEKDDDRGLKEQEYPN